MFKSLLLQPYYAFIFVVFFFTFLSSPSSHAQGQDINVRGNSNQINNNSMTSDLNNNTDFGSSDIAIPVVHSFEIENTFPNGNPGDNILTISNITTSGTNAGDFVVTNSITTIQRNNSAFFDITFTPSGTGTRSATVTIASDDPDENPYEFYIEGLGTMPLPEIEIEDSSNNIITSGGNFDFGTISPSSSATETFSVYNKGAGSTTLTLEGIDPDYVTISGDPEFSISVQPGNSTISGGNSESFSIQYNPTAIGGPHNAILSIDNDDPDGSEDPYLINLTGLSDNITYVPTTSGPDWTVTNITADDALSYPNEITYGPDGYLWITERRLYNGFGESVVRVDPNNGTKTTMLDLSSNVYSAAGQDGLMGMAIHPDLYTDINSANNYVYLAYTYDNGGRKLRIARYSYNSGTGLLDAGTAFTLIDEIDASNDHNSGRLKIGPDLKLYYTIGDQGANQFGNACNEIQAQDLPTSTTDFDAYKGKVLRLNLDGTIPNDNPILGSMIEPTHVYTYGHRNAQGLIFGSDGTLYSSEHGPKVDDELNIIKAGQNYGWPEIAGYYDNQGYSYCNWSSLGGSCNSGDFSDHNCAVGITPLPEFTSGMPSDFEPPIGTYNSTSVIEPSGGWLTWPTVGPSSIDIYEGGLIPDWDKSLLITTLKRGTIFRAKLNVTGDGLESQVYEEFHSSNDRYRDITMDPDGLTIYAITDNTGGTSGPSGTTGVTIQNPGVIVKIQFTGTVLNTNNIVQTNNTIKLVPNPASSQFKIVGNQVTNEISAIQVLDINGRFIKSLDNDTQIFNIEDLSNGLYFVRLLDNNNQLIVTIKLLINK